MSTEYRIRRDDASAFVPFVVERYDGKLLGWTHVRRMANGSEESLKMAAESDMLVRSGKETKHLVIND